MKKVTFTFGIIVFCSIAKTQTPCIQGHSHEDGNPLQKRNEIPSYAGMTGERMDIEIFDIVGGEVPSPSERAEGEVIIDVSHLAKGMYFLKKDGKVVKFVKE